MQPPHLCASGLKMRWMCPAATSSSVTEQITLQQQIIVSEKSSAGRFSLQDGAAIELFFLTNHFEKCVHSWQTGQIRLQLAVSHSLLDSCVEQKILVNSLSVHSATIFSFSVVQHCAVLYPISLRDIKTFREKCDSFQLNYQNHEETLGHLPRCKMLEFICILFTDIPLNLFLLQFLLLQHNPRHGFYGYSL